jgi:hypothetical protein
MATKTNSKTKTAAAKKPARKTTAQAKTAAPKRKAAKRVVAPLARNTAATMSNIDWKQALIGGGIGAAIGGLATKLIFLR